MAPRPAGTGLDDLASAQQRIRDDIVRRINRPEVEVLITTTDQSTPTPRSPELVFVYSDDSMTVQSLGTPLVLTVACADASAGSAINVHLWFDKIA